MAKATITFQSDDKDVIASIDKMNAKMADMQAKLQQQNEKNNSGFSMVVGTLAKMAMGYLSINTAIEAGNQALRDRIALQEKARDKQLEAAAGEREFLLNQGFVSKAQRDQTAAALEQISKQRGVSLQTVRSVAGSAMSSAGGDWRAATQAASGALALQPFDTATAAELAGAALRISRARGKMDPDQGFRSINEIGMSSDVKDWRQMARYAPVGIGAATANQFSGDAAEAAYIALTKSGDTEGSTSATALATFSSKLRDFLPEKDIFTTNVATGKKTLKARGTGLKTGDERLQRLLTDPETNARFLATLEASLDKPFIEKLITPGNIVSETYAQQMAKRRGAGGLVGAEEFAAQMNETPLQRTADLERRLQRPVDKRLEEATGSARYAIVRSKLDELYEAQGVGTWNGSRWSRARSFDIAGFNMPAEEAGIATLKDYGKELVMGMSGTKAGSQERQEFQQKLREANEQIDELRRAIQMRDQKNDPVVQELKSIKQGQRAGNSRQHLEGR